MEYPKLYGVVEVDIHSIVPYSVSLRFQAWDDEHIGRIGAVDVLRIVTSHRYLAVEKPRIANIEKTFEEISVGLAQWRFPTSEVPKVR